MIGTMLKRNSTFVILTIGIFIIIVTALYGLHRLYVNHTMQPKPIMVDDKWEKRLIDTGIPLIRIDTENGEEPTFEIANKPEGLRGQGITNAQKKHGELTLLSRNGILYKSGTFEKGKTGITIKVRGNTSAVNPQRPYAITLQRKADLLMRGDGGNYEDKKWILLPYTDLNALVGFRTSKLLGLQWTPAYGFVNLVVNGDYRGLYMLVESIKRNVDCRLNVDKESGYIFEYDPYYWNEEVSVESTFGERMGYTFKYPDESDLKEEQLKRFKEYIHRVEASLSDCTYSSFIDLQSFSSFLLARDILGFGDHSGTNYIMTKYDSTSTSTIKMGTLWDFDSMFGRPNDWDGAHEFSWFKMLYNCRDFRYEYICKWNEIKDSFFSDIVASLDEFMNSDYGKGVAKSIEYNNMRWPNQPRSSIDECIQKSKTWFVKREKWLNQAIQKL